MSANLGAENQYYVRALISDQSGSADLVDPNLSNPWGINFGLASPVWIGNNAAGIVTLYEAIPPTIGASRYTIPSPAGSGAAITSVVTFGVVDRALTPLPGGDVQVNLNPLFCTQDGAIVGVFPPPTIVPPPQNLTIPPPWPKSP